MKKIFFLFFIIILFGCSSKKNILETDITELKKEGTTLLHNQKINNEYEITTINNVNLYPEFQHNNIQISAYPYFNSSNLIKNFKLFSQLKVSQIERDIEYNKNNFFQKEILQFNEKIIYVDDNSNLLIFNQNLNLIKKYKIHKKDFFDTYPLRFSLSINNNVLYISDNLGFIIAYDLINFSLLWKNNFSVPFLSNLIIHKESVYVTNANGKLFSFDKFTGKQNWSFETGTSSLKSYHAYKMSLLDDILFFSNDLGNLFSINLKTQTIMWNINIPYSKSTVGEEFLKIGPLVATDGSLYLTSNLGKFLKIHVNDGSFDWVFEVISFINPIINPSTILLVDQNGFFLILDKKKGNLLYKRKILELLPNKADIKYISFNNMFLASGNIYITTNNGFVFIIDSKNLKNISIKKISESVSSNIVFDNSNFYFVGNKGYIYKIK